MIKIKIHTEFASKEELIETLHIIANQINKGYSRGIGSWEIEETNRNQEKIDYIKKVLSDWGMTSTADLELDSSPMYNSIGSNHVMLIEEFTQDYVRVVEYVHENIVDEWELSYEELSDELIDEIYNIIEGYEADQEKTWKRCQD